MRRSCRGVCGPLVSTCPWSMGWTTHSPSLAVLPLRRSTHSSRKRLRMGSRVARGVLRNRLDANTSLTLESAAAGCPTARSSSERCSPRPQLESAQPCPSSIDATHPQRRVWPCRRHRRRVRCGGGGGGREKGKKWNGRRDGGQKGIEGICGRTRRLGSLKESIAIIIEYCRS